MDSPIIKVRGLKKYYPLRSSLFSKNIDVVKAVDGVDFDVFPKETLALVGESGCGKTTVAKTILGLVTPSEGSIQFLGKDFSKLTKEGQKHVQKNMQIVFQNPYASLNPRQTIGQILYVPFKVHKFGTNTEIKQRVIEILEHVGLSPAEQYLTKHPHELSGGQRQRVGVARAIALNPKVIICDEPVSALDMSVRGQILNLLNDIQSKFGIAYIFITHDLSVVRTIASRVLVMYLGKIVEAGSVEDVIEKPLHKYTQMLIAATPRPDPKLAKETTRSAITGDVPSSVNPQSGCRFRTRCSMVMKICSEIEPLLTENQNDHKVACHLCN